jgi:glucose-1-phosphate cytidylyltransferase
VKRVAPYVGDGTFLLTYGDGVSDVDVGALVEFHRSHGRLATVTAAQPGGRFGALDLGEGDAVRGFQEKPQGDGGWVNAGFFVMEPGVLDHIDGDATMLEREPMERLARKGELVARKHFGFWQPMDTLRDKNHLEALWQSGKAPWRTWE